MALRNAALVRCSGSDKTGKNETITMLFKPEHLMPVTDSWEPGEVRTMDNIYHVLENRNKRDTVNSLDLDSIISTHI